jgi:hypothetical protein
VLAKKLKIALHAVPSYEMLVRYLPRAKTALGHTRT